MKNKVKIRIFVCCAFFALFFGFKLPIVAADDVDMEAPTMDGVIGIAEWMNADVYETFFIDAENTDGNIDANNSLYIGEDDDNLYIGLDLNSDQSPNTTGEWVGVWLNTNNRTFDNGREWESYLDNGTESFIYNVEDDSIWDPWKDDGSMGEVSRDFQDESEVQTIAGTTSDGIFELNNGGNPYVVESNASSVIWINFAVNMSDWFGYQKDLQVNMIEQFVIYVGSNLSAPIHSQNLLIWYPNGTYNEYDPAQNIALPTNSGLNSSTTYIDSSNKSSDNLFRFSLVLDHQGDFEVIYDVIRIRMVLNQTNNPADFYFSPYTTLNNAQINYSFTGSPINASAHRQFEIKIPKSELEHYNSTNELGIIVGGYGTLNFANKNYWSYSIDLQTLPGEKSDEYIYFNMSESGGLPPSSPVITTQNQTINTSSILIDWNTVTDATVSTLHQWYVKCDNEYYES
jgi:hypothetical protein